MQKEASGFTTLEKVKNYVATIQWEKRLKKEVPFLTKLFQKHNYTKILDLGSGPGFHAKELAKNGFIVKGLDINENMIQYAKENYTDPNLSISFETGDFLNDDNALSGKWDAIFSLGNAIMIIWSQENVDTQEMFNRLGKAITNNGAIFFQILNSDNPRKGYVVSKIAKSQDKNTNQILIKHFIPVGNKLYTNFMTLKWKDSDQEVTKEENEPGFLKLIPLEELKGYLSKAGFNKFEFFDNYDGTLLDTKTSDSLLCFAQK
ncbi:MAG: Glycine/sarcosine N-methyltransferase [Candidatus Heimdallarchaeota archaeon LC_3]|nr:MAG: Glycine/sarcosine N-methyltransferase [Candidatus Heimdallarchaeota archaeon LC_3]